MSDHPVVIRPAVLLPVANRKALLWHFQTQDDRVCLWVPGYLNRSAGQEVDVEIALAEERMLFHSRGVVRWKRVKSQPNLPAGIGVELLAEEWRTQEIVLGFARGDGSPLVQRRHRRFPVMLGGSLLLPHNVIVPVRTSDLSREGASLTGASAPAPGETVSLEIRAPDRSFVRIKAEVRWRITNGRTRFGVQFVFEDMETQKQVQAALAEIKRRLHEG